MNKKTWSNSPEILQMMTPFTFPGFIQKLQHVEFSPWKGWKDSVLLISKECSRKASTQKKVAIKGAQIFLEMIFRDSFYHADPHPGNIWVEPDGRIGLLDFGMAGRLDTHTRDDLEEMLLAAVNRDPDRITELVLRIGSVPKGIDRNGLNIEVSEFVDEYISDSLKDFDLSGAFKGLTKIIRDYRIILPSGISMLLKVLIMLEGTSRALNRDFNLAELLKPYQAKSIRQRYSPERLLSRLKRTYRDWDRLLEMLPIQLAEIPAADEGRQFRCLPGAPPAGHNRQSFGLLYIDCGPFSGLLLFAGPENSTSVCGRIHIWNGRLSAVSISGHSTFHSDQKIG